MRFTCCSLSIAATSDWNSFSLRLGSLSMRFTATWVPSGRILWNKRLTLRAQSQMFRHSVSQQCSNHTVRVFGFKLSTPWNKSQPDYQVSQGYLWKRYRKPPRPKIERKLSVAASSSLYVNFVGTPATSLRKLYSFLSRFSEIISNCFILWLYPFLTMTIAI